MEIGKLRIAASAVNREENAGDGHQSDNFAPVNKGEIIGPDLTCRKVNKSDKCESEPKGNIKSVENHEKNAKTLNLANSSMSTAT